MSHVRVVAVALAMVLALSGCVPTRPVPPPPGDEEMAQLYRDRIEQMWALSGLEGEQPDSSFGSDTVGMSQFIACLDESGAFDDGLTFTDGPEGVQVRTQSGGDLDEDHRRIAYDCFAAHPSLEGMSDTVWTPEQADYVYDLYADRLMPCLMAQGFSTGGYVPTREDFVSMGAGRWSPYATLERSDEQRSMLAFRICRHPVLQGNVIGRI